MKKIITTLAFAIAAFSFGSCEDIFESCNCGRVLSDNVQDYSVVIRNSCSGNEKKFTLSRGDWMNAHVGSNYCITNIESW